MVFAPTWCPRTIWVRIYYFTLFQLIVLDLLYGFNDRISEYKPFYNNSHWLIFCLCTYTVKRRGSYAAFPNVGLFILADISRKVFYNFFNLPKDV